MKEIVHIYIYTTPNGTNLDPAPKRITIRTTLMEISPQVIIANRNLMHYSIDDNQKH